MMKQIKNNKGISLINVIIIITVSVILAAIFIEAAMANFKFSKSSEYMDYSYFAAHSALEMCFDAIDKKCGEGNFKVGSASLFLKSTTDSDKIIEFASDVVNHNIVPAILDLKNANKFDGIDIADTGVAGKMANVKSISLNLVNNPAPTYTNKQVIMTVGVTVTVDYVNKPFVSGTKTVYGQRTFKVNAPLSYIMDLLGPIYTVGDFFVEKAAVTVSGDVRVYGTSPDKLVQPEQYYYGGIMAKDHANVRIEGNAYTRSFVRAGLYNSDEDKSRIDVTRDAVAQSLQLFGVSDKLYVYRNAYTLDDVEVDSEDSVIGINGSFFGVSRGALTHDDSSAIVNAAPVHFASSDVSKKSRIVVNGAVLINGSTFKIDPEDGTIISQIEDASLYWMKDETNPNLNNIFEGPLYKMLNVVTSDFKNWRQQYQQANPSATIKGFGNLFQVWDPRDYKDQLSINQWIGYIESARQVAQNDVTNFDNKGNGSYSQNPAFIERSEAPHGPDKIKGYCNSELAANDSIYTITKQGPGAEIASWVESAYDGFLKSGATYPFTFAKNVLDSKIYGDKWENYWALSDTSWVNGYCGDVEVHPGIPYKLKKLYDPLAAIPSEFYKRITYSEDGNGDRIDTTGYTQHNNTGAFKRISTALNGLSANNHIINITNDSTFGTFPSFKDYLNSKSWVQGEYYIIINDDPSKVITLTDITFNGIIFTAGRVELRGDSGPVKVEGAIIAAGWGWNNTNYVIDTSKSAAESVDYLQRVSEANDGSGNVYGLNQLNSGDFAAVFCSTTNVANDIQINFPLKAGGDPDDAGARRNELLDKFTPYGIDLYPIFKTEN